MGLLGKCAGVVEGAWDGEKTKGEGRGEGESHVYVVGEVEVSTFCQVLERQRIIEFTLSFCEVGAPFCRQEY